MLSIEQIARICYEMCRAYDQEAEKSDEKSEWEHLKERVAANPAIGVGRGTVTKGAAILASYRLTPHVSLAARAEYIASTGNANDGAANLMYGPGSKAWSITITPTYQDQDFFARAELSFVQAVNYTQGDVFGPQGNNPAQARALVETGFLF